MGLKDKLIFHLKASINFSCVHKINQCLVRQGLVAVSYELDLTLIIVRASCGSSQTCSLLYLKKVRYNIHTLATYILFGINKLLWNIYYINTYIIYIVWHHFVYHASVHCSIAAGPPTRGVLTSLSCARLNAAPRSFRDGSPGVAGPMAITQVSINEIPIFLRERNQTRTIPCILGESSGRKLYGDTWRYDRSFVFLSQLFHLFSCYEIIPEIKITISSRNPS